MASPEVFVLITFFSITAIASSSSTRSCINNYNKNNNNFNSSVIIQQQQQQEEEEGCVLVADEDHSEFLMDSHISSSSRMFLNFEPVTPKTGNRRPVTNCGRGKPYVLCTPKPNSSKPPEHCGGKVYNQNRVCG